MYKDFSSSSQHPKSQCIFISDGTSGHTSAPTTQLPTTLIHAVARSCMAALTAVQKITTKHLTMARLLMALESNAKQHQWSQVWGASLVQTKSKKEPITKVWFLSQGQDQALGHLEESLHPLVATCKSRI